MSQQRPVTPVPILQREGEFDELLVMYAERQPKRVLEVGTYHGGTLYHWLQNARSEPGRYTVNGASYIVGEPGPVPQAPMIVSVDSYAAGVDNRHLYPEWVPEGVRLEVIQGDSRDPAIIESVRRLGPYDWIFIDAGHSYEEVSADWLNYGPMCAKGGLVAFHDILYSGVAQLWTEIKKDYAGPKVQIRAYETREIISDPITEWPGWCGIGCVMM